MIAHELTFTASAFANLVRQLAAGAPAVRLACGVSILPEHWEWLVAGSPAVREAPALIAVAGRHPEVLATLAQEHVDHFTGNIIVFALGLGPAQGHSAGLVRLRHVVNPLYGFRVVAAGLPRVVLGARRHVKPIDPEARARFSRTISALGEDTFRRLQSVHIAVVGCGRLGSLVAEHLASCGIARLSLIDPDHMEPHNFGEMAYLPAAAHAKAHALAAQLRPLSGTTIDAITAPIQTVPALDVLKAADIVISCPDNTAARIATAQIAALYLKPVLDIGTGIVRTRGERQMGFDVRWLFPSHCVNCTNSPTAHEPPSRLGSLRSLNTFAVGAAMTLLEQFLRGTLAESLWLQANLDHTGTPNIQRPTLGPSTLCPICATAGQGDDGLMRI